METKRPKNMNLLVDFNDKLIKIYELCFKIQNKGLATVFIDFSGHIEQIEINIYMGGWSDRHHDPERMQMYVGAGDYMEDVADSIINRLTKIWESEISYEEIQAKREQEELERKRAQYEKLKAEFES